MTAAVTARCIIFSNEGLAAGLRALEFLLLSVGRRMTAEQLECEALILFALLLRNRLETFKLDEGLGAIAPASIEHAGNDYHAVDLLGREFFLVLDQPHGGFHSRRVLFLVELALTE